MSTADPRLDFEARLSEHLAHRIEPGCLEADALLEVAEMGPRAPDFANRMAHIAACSRCHALLRELRQVPPVAAESGRSARRWLWVLVPAAALLLAAFFVRQIQERERQERFVEERHALPEVRFDPGFRPPQEGSIEAKGPEPDRTTPKPPDDGSPPPDPGPDFVPFEPPAPPSPSRLPGNLVEKSDGLYEGDVRIDDLVAADVRAIAGEPENVRGPGRIERPPIVLGRPEIGNRLLREARPTFEWMRYSEATGYEVRLLRLPRPDETAPTPIVIEVSGLSARPSNPLEAGQTYRLEIEAKVRGEDPVGEKNPSAMYVFRMPDAEESRKLDWAIAHEERAPMAAAMVFLALGRFADAERVMPRTDEPRVLAWRRNIEETLKRRLSEPNR